MVSTIAQEREDTAVRDRAYLEVRNPSLYLLDCQRKIQKKDCSNLRGNDPAVYVALATNFNRANDLLLVEPGERSIQTNAGLL